MDRDGQEQRASFAFLPAFTAGMYDGVNPCSFALALIFLTYFSIIGKTPWRIFWLGLLFILAAIATNVALAFGVFDFLMIMPSAMKVVTVGYWIMAIVFVSFGVLDILDWWRYKKNSDTALFRRALPVFLGPCQERKATSLARRVLLGVMAILATLLIAFASTLAGSTFPQREYIFIVHSFYIAGGDKLFAFWSFLQYSVALVLPLIVLWMIVLFVSFSGRTRKKVISYYKGISAALFLAVGVGLGYFLLG